MGSSYVIVNPKREVTASRWGEFPKSPDLEQFPGIRKNAATPVFLASGRAGNWIRRNLEFAAETEKFELGGSILMGHCRDSSISGESDVSTQADAPRAELTASAGRVALQFALEGPLDGRAAAQADQLDQPSVELLGISTARQLRPG